MGETKTEHTEKPEFELSKRQWKFLQECLENDETVLFVGPGILPFPGFDTVEDALNDYLQKASAAEPDPFIEKFYRDDKFFRLNEEDSESLWMFMSCYRDFFAEHKEELQEAREVLRKIAAIPFSTIISLIPNTMIEEAYGEDLAFHADLYYKKEKPNPFVPGKKEDPLIYYMRGKMTEDESMIISHTDLFDYLESIYEAKSMDTKFKTALKKARYYVFLGLPLESWYMQLLLRLFEFHVKKPKILALKRFADQSQNQKVVYEDLYQVNFYENESVEFIKQLYQRYDDLGQLRVAKANSGKAASFERDAQEYHVLVKDGNHDDALRKLEELSEEYLDESKHQSYFDLLVTGSSTYRAALNDYNINKITFDKFQTFRAKLTGMMSMQFKELKALVNEQ